MSILSRRRQHNDVLYEEHLNFEESDQSETTS